MADDEQAEASRRAIEEARRRWAVRAGRKGTHAEDPEAAKARIVSPLSMGG